MENRFIDKKYKKVISAFLKGKLEKQKKKKKYFTIFLSYLNQVVSVKALVLRIHWFKLSVYLQNYSDALLFLISQPKESVNKARYPSSRDYNVSFQNSSCKLDSSHFELFISRPAHLIWPRKERCMEKERFYCIGL